MRMMPAIGVGAVVVLLLIGSVYGGMISYEKCAAFIEHSRLFTVKKIVVTGNKRSSVAEIMKRCGIKESAKIYNVTTAAVSASLLSDPWIENVRCVKKWWGSVAITIKERTPIALVNTGEVKLVDQYGVLLPVEPGKTYDLPLISALRTTVDHTGRVRIDSTTIARLHRFLSNAQAENEGLFRSITQLDMGNTGVINCKVSGQPTTIQIGYDADTKQLRNLQYLLEVLANDRGTVARIDMRYQNLAFVCRGPSGPSGRAGEINN